MSTKMKGLLKGLRYISQIFDDDKEPEMQIGFPTDVKHVAHIGWDGPSVDSPSWMHDFKSPSGFQSAPLAPPGDSKDNSEVKWVSEDSSSRRGTRTPNSPARELPELPKSSRRHSSTDNALTSETLRGDPSSKSRHSRRNKSNKELSENSLPPESPRRKSSTKSRSSQRHHSKDSSDSIKANRVPEDPGLGIDSPSRNTPDIPKKSRRKKSKESIGGGSSRPSRSKNNESYQASNLKPLDQEEEKESRAYLE